MNQELYLCQICRKPLHLFEDLYQTKSGWVCMDCIEWHDEGISDDSIILIS